MNTTNNVTLTDVEFLTWLHKRLIHDYKEPPMSSHLCKLRGVIDEMSKDTTSPYKGMSGDTYEF